MTAYGDHTIITVGDAIEIIRAPQTQRRGPAPEDSGNDEEDLGF